MRNGNGYQIFVLIEMQIGKRQNNLAVFFIKICSWFWEQFIQITIVAIYTCVVGNRIDLFHKEEGIAVFTCNSGIEITNEYHLFAVALPKSSSQVMIDSAFFIVNLILVKCIFIEFGAEKKNEHNTYNKHNERNKRRNQENIFFSWFVFHAGAPRR